jgi:glycerophosphoryl diester phosphodiesterase
LGATGLESDAWLTADGEVVLDHDGVTGPPWRHRAISAQHQADLPSHIPSLSQLYAECGADFELSLDVKDPAALRPLLAVAGEASAIGRLWLCHHDWRVMAGWRPDAGQARLVESTRLKWIPEGLQARAAALRESGLDAINMHRSEWSAGNVAAVHAAGLRAFGWDAQSSADIRTLVDIGIDGVYSDHVERLMAEVG